MSKSWDIKQLPGKIQAWWHSWSTWKYWLLGALPPLLVTIAAAFVFQRQYAMECVNSADLDECIFLGKTAWEWMELLVVPILLLIGGFIADGYFKSRDKDRDRQAALKDYLDDMTDLFLCNAWKYATQLQLSNFSPLLIAQPNPEKERVAAIAEARTLAALNDLDKARQIELIRFLSKSGQLQHFQFPGQRLNLQEANLWGVNLQGANLEGANLQGANLWKVNLQGANLEEANLQGADLGSANLQGAYLKDANLQEADLREVNLQGAKLWYVHLQEAYLEGANLQGADLGSANLQGANLWGVNLQGADLGSANLQEAGLAGTNLQGVYLGSVNLRGADLGGANLQGADLREANLQRADLGSANLQETYLGGANLQGAYLGSVNLRKAILLATDLRGVLAMTIEQLEHQNQPYLCNVALPNSTQDINPDRDCAILPTVLVEKSFEENVSLSFEEARQIVENARLRRWD
ncbi:MAG: pentapeptide repeat-containing protein [Cyanobacteria bacterium J06638_20]